MGRRRSTRPSVRWGLSRAEAVKAGYRSTYEYAIALDLQERGIEFEYEAETYKLYLPATRSYECLSCGMQPVKLTHYTPDFSFFDGKFVVEAKGRFDPQHRAKALAFVEQHPDIEYALLFEENNKLSTKSKTRYTEWCGKHGILCDVGLMPVAWLEGAFE